MLFIVPAIALDVGARTTAPASSSEVKAAFIFGRYTNLTADNGYLTIEAVNVWVIYKEPRSFAHFPRGTQVTFDMYSAYGHMFKKINVLFLHVELVV
ncbi:MAG: hypothetical protein JXA00_05485 [Candidatus Thermoplasmatota archaeon]|nr:hypothetical protein [Candidatus Thermoplasmatota archaeon]